MTDLRSSSVAVRLRSLLASLLRTIDTADARKMAVALFVAALLLRLVATTLMYLSSVYAGRKGFIGWKLDPYHYDMYSWKVAQALRSGRFLSITTDAHSTDVLYYYILAVLYAVVGHVPLAGRILGALAGALVPLLKGDGWNQRARDGTRLLCPGCHPLTSEL